MILAPATETSPLIAAIGISGHIITTALPSRDERFVQLVRGLDYLWNRESQSWQRTIDPVINGSVTDRAVELAVTLLSAGYAVECGDDLAALVQFGQYESEHRRWVLARKAGAEYAGWFVLRWPRSENYYARAIRLPGARYSPPSVVVPPDAYLAVQDFCDAHGFRLSPIAQQMVATQTERRRAAVLADVQPKPRAPKPATQPSAPGIHPELRDDDMADDN